MMRHSEYWMAAIGLLLVGVLAVRVLPRERPAPAPEEAPVESTPSLAKVFETGIDFSEVLTPTEQRRDARYSGQVIAEDGSPVTDARIRAYTRNGRPFRARSDEHGAFSMRAIRSAARMYFRVEAPGFALIPAEPTGGVFEVTDENRGGIQLVLEPESTASGVVVDAAGATVQGVHVGIEPVDDEYFDERQTAGSESDGTFTIRQIAAGEYRLFVARVRNDDVQQFRIGRAEHLTGLRVVIETKTTDGVFLSGLVTDRAGNAVSDVQLVERGWYWVGGTARDGRFQARVLGFPTSITAQHPDYSFTTVTVDGQTRDLRIVLDPPATVSGRVVYADTGKPVTRFRIRSRMGHLDYFENPEGRFDDVRLSAAAAEIRVFVHGHPPAVAEFKAEAAGEVRTGIEVRVPPSSEGTWLEGRVTDGRGLTDSGGWPVREANVLVDGSSHSGLSDVTDDDGGFLLGPLSHGPVDIVVRTPEGKDRSFRLHVSPATATEFREFNLDSPDATAVPD